MKGKAGVVAGGGVQPLESCTSGSCVAGKANSNESKYEVDMHGMKVVLCVFLASSKTDLLDAQVVGVGGHQARHSFSR
jgi:hypothetical protein